jgi:hypothetical protein
LLVEARQLGAAQCRGRGTGFQEGSALDHVFASMRKTDWWTIAGFAARPNGTTPNAFP